MEKNGRWGLHFYFLLSLSLAWQHTFVTLRKEKESRMGSKAEHGDLEQSGSPRGQVRESEPRGPEIEAWTAHRTTRECRAVLAPGHQGPSRMVEERATGASESVMHQVVTSSLLWPQNMAVLLSREPRCLPPSHASEAVVVPCVLYAR